MLVWASLGSNFSTARDPIGYKESREPLPRLLQRLWDEDHGGLVCRVGDVVDLLAEDSDHSSVGMFEKGRPENAGRQIRNYT